MYTLQRLIGVVFFGKYKKSTFLYCKRTISWHVLLYTSIMYLYFNLVLSYLIQFFISYSHYLYFHSTIFSFLYTHDKDGELPKYIVDTLVYSYINIHTR